MRKEDDNQTPTKNLPKFPLSEKQAWLLLEWLQKTGETRTVTIKSIAGKQAGLQTELYNIPAFIPISRVIDFPHKRSFREREKYLKNLIGCQIPVQVLEAIPPRKRLVLGQFSAEREIRQARTDGVFLKLKEGEIREGVVTALHDFGAVVDLGGADGFIHISEIAWGRFVHPRDVFKIGDKVKVLILSMDQDKKRIGLSLKRLQPNPWEKVNEHYQVGQLVTGIINRVASMGVFINLEHDIEALLPVNEIPALLKMGLKANFREGQAIPVRVLDIQADQWHMGVTMLTITDAERRAWAAAQKTGT